MMNPRFYKINAFLRIFLRKSVIGVTLAPFGIYMREDYLNNESVRDHEKIHWRQQLELLIIFFYILYFIEWIVRLFINKKTAYRNISFEKEAYDNSNETDYLKFRKPYAWIYRIRK